MFLAESQRGREGIQVHEPPFSQHHPFYLLTERNCFSFLIATVSFWPGACFATELVGRILSREETDYTGILGNRWMARIAGEATFKASSVSK